MSLPIKPRPVSPINIIQWARQAVDLIGRNFGAWLVLMLLFCLATYALRMSRVLDHAISGAAFLTGIGVAAYVDDSRPKSLLDILTAAAHELPRALRYASIIALVEYVGSVLIWAVTGQHDRVLKELYDTAVPVLGMDVAADGFRLAAVNSMFLYPLMGLFDFYFTSIVPGLSSPFHYHVSAMFGLDWKHGRRFGLAGMPQINLAVMLVFNTLIMALMLATALIAAVAAPAVVAFASAMSYVAFREIYIGIGHNRKLESVQARNQIQSAA